MVSHGPDRRDFIGKSSRVGFEFVVYANLLLFSPMVRTHLATSFKASDPVKEIILGGLRNISFLRATLNSQSVPAAPRTNLSKPILA